MPRNHCLRVAGAAGWALLTLFAVAISRTPPAGADTLLVRTEPAGNSVVAASPQAITLDFSQPVDAAGSTVAVFSADHRPRAAGAHVQAVPDNPNALTLALPALPKGTYTVVWSAAGADGATQGVFAFGVDPSGGSPVVARQPQPVQTLSPLPRVVTKWLAFVMIM